MSKRKLHRGRGFGGRGEFSKAPCERPNKARVVSFRTYLDVAVAVAALASDNLYYEDFCLSTGQRRIPVGRLHSLLEEDPDRRRGHCRHASGQPHGREDGSA